MGEGGLVFGLNNLADALFRSVNSGQTGDMVGYETVLVHKCGVAQRVNIELTVGIWDKKVRFGIHGRMGEIWVFF